MDFDTHIYLFGLISIYVFFRVYGYDDDYWLFIGLHTHILIYSSAALFLLILYCEYMPSE